MDLKVQLRDLRLNGRVLMRRRVVFQMAGDKRTVFVDIRIISSPVTYHRLFGLKLKIIEIVMRQHDLWNSLGGSLVNTYSLLFIQKLKS